MERLQRFGERFFGGADVVERLSVDRLEVSGGGNDTLEIFMGKHNGAVHEITQDSYQFGIVAGLEIAPGEIIVFRLGSVGWEPPP